MRYEEFYNEQVIKYKKRRVFLTKRLPFIIIGVIILLSIILTLFFTSGTPYEYGLLNIEYGDTISLEPKSFLASSSYEYFVDGDYTELAPTKPGIYSYRIKSTNIFGVTKYSSDFEFEIKKAKAYITIGDTEINYGEDPKRIVSNLPYDKKISSYTISYSNYHRLTTEAWISDVCILDSNLEDVTDYYDLEFPKVTISINKAPLVIKLKDKEKEYDSTPLEYEDSSDYEIEGLLEDNLIIEIKTEGSQTLVGESEYNVSSVTITDQDGNSYETYGWTATGATLKVTPKPISLKTLDENVTYNGENQKFDSYTLSEEIPDTLTVTPLTLNTVGVYDYELIPTIMNGDLDVTYCYQITYDFGKVEIEKASATISLSDLSLTYSGSNTFDGLFELDNGSLFDSELKIKVLSSIREVGSGTISIKSYTLTKNGKDVSSCFDLEFIDGEIEITKKDLLIKPKDFEKEYDGLNFETNEYEQEGLVDSDTLTVSSKSTDTAVGLAEITVDEISILHNDLDVSSCYNIEYDKGILTITKKNINIYLKDIEITYGDTPIFDFEVEGLLGLDEFNVITYSFESNIGENEIDITDYSITDGLNDNIDLYDVNIHKGTLTINKKALTISVYSKSKVYDGTYLELAPTDYYISSGELLATDNITFYPGNESITDVGVKVVTINSTNLIIMNQDNETVTDFYDIEYQTGSLTITPRVVNIITGSITKPFDFNRLTCLEYTVSGLISGNEIEIEITGELFYIGSTKNTVGSIKVYSSNSIDKIDITQNYTFNVYEGTLTYTERSA